MEKENRLAAIARLEKISPDFEQWPDVYRDLVSVYCELLRDGDYSRSERVNLDAEAEARYRLGIELWGKGELQGAAEVLAEIYPQAKEFEQSRSELAQIYAAWGQQERQAGRWQRAIALWDKAIALSPDLEGTLRRRIRESKTRTWLQYNKTYIDIIGVVFAILAVVVTVWQLDWLGLKPLPATPTPRPVTLCNGSFEDGLACWEHGGELDQTVACDEDRCFAVLGSPEYECAGGVPVGEAWMKQSFEVPDEISPTLSLSYRISSYDLSLHDIDLPGYDYFQVAINGELRPERYGNTDWAEASCAREPWDSGWQPLVIDLTDHRGEQVEVSFHNFNGTHPDYNTWTYIADVRIDVGN